MFETADPLLSMNMMMMISLLVLSHAVPVGDGVDDAKSVFLDSHSLSPTNPDRHTMDACPLP